MSPASPLLEIAKCDGIFFWTTVLLMVGLWVGKQLLAGTTRKDK